MKGSYSGRNTSFGRLGGEPVAATFLADGENAEILMDRFGDVPEICEHGDDTAKAIAKIRKSEPFFDWIAGHGGTMRVVGPKNLKNEYNEYKKGLIEE